MSKTLSITLFMIVIIIMLIVIPITANWLISLEVNEMVKAIRLLFFVIVIFAGAVALFIGNLLKVFKEH